MIKTYSELVKLQTIEERFDYLKLSGIVGAETFGCDRYIYQKFLHSTEWRNFRNYIITRDQACDLAVDGYDIFEGITIHHINPVTVEDAKKDWSKLMNPEFVVCCSDRTHKAIHYGDRSLLPQPILVRRPGDTLPWI